MISPGLAVLPCLWAVWNIIGVITTYIMTITASHYETPYISISDTGAKFPESTVMMVVSTVSELLGAAIMYVMYRLIVIRTAERTRTRDILEKILLAIGWLSCVGNIITTYLQDSTMKDYITIAALLCSALYIVFVTEPRAAASRNGRCVLITRTMLNVLLFLVFMSSYFPIYVLLTVMTCKIVTISDCTSDSCIKLLNITMAILEWLVLLFSCTDNILLCQDFQALTIKSWKSLKKDWIIPRNDLEEILPLYRKSYPNR